VFHAMINDVLRDFLDHFVYVYLDDIRSRMVRCIPAPSYHGCPKQKETMMSATGSCWQSRSPCRHWLEGGNHPFIILTDHENLGYIKKAKRLNSRQARWPLFFNRFSFSLSYRPGSQNVKPDALSGLFDPEPVAKEPETILPLTCVVGVVTWQIAKEVKQANGEAPPPSGCPENRLFVPVELRPQVIHWAHTSLLSCHPEVQRTMFAISRRFWLPSMEPEVREYVEGCSVCAQNKTSSGSRMGLLQPLPLPSRPWSDISMDFVTGFRYLKETPLSSQWWTDFPR